MTMNQIDEAWDLFYDSLDDVDKRRKVLENLHSTDPYIESYQENLEALREDEYGLITAAEILADMVLNTQDKLVKKNWMNNLITEYTRSPEMASLEQSNTSLKSSSVSSQETHSLKEESTSSEDEPEKNDDPTPQ